MSSMVLSMDSTRGSVLPHDAGARGWGVSAGLNGLQVGGWGPSGSSGAPSIGRGGCSARECPGSCSAGGVVGSAAWNGPSPAAVLCAGSGAVRSTACSRLSDLLRGDELGEGGEAAGEAERGSQAASSLASSGDGDWGGSPARCPWWLTRGGASRGLLRIGVQSKLLLPRPWLGELPPLEAPVADGSSAAVTVPCTAGCRRSQCCRAERFG